VFSDFFSTFVWSLAQNPEHPEHWRRTRLTSAGFLVSAFGEGEDRELYLCDYLAGRIMKLIGSNPP
jgi:hypothetical protein